MAVYNLTKDFICYHGCHRLCTTTMAFDCPDKASHCLMVTLLLTAPVVDQLINLFIDTGSSRRLCDTETLEDFNTALDWSVKTLGAAGMNSSVLTVFTNAAAASNHVLNIDGDAFVKDKGIRIMIISKHTLLSVMVVRSTHSGCCTNIDLGDNFILCVRQWQANMKQKRTHRGERMVNHNCHQMKRKTQRDRHKESHHYPNWNRCLQSHCRATYGPLHLSSCTHTHICFYSWVHMRTLNKNVLSPHCLCLRIEVHTLKAMTPSDQMTTACTVRLETRKSDGGGNRADLKLGRYYFLCILLMCVSEVAVHWYWFPQGWFNMPLLLLWPIKPLW